jgi:hypothetical protein
MLDTLTSPNPRVLPMSFRGLLEDRQVLLCFVWHLKFDYSDFLNMREVVILDVTIATGSKKEGQVGRQVRQKRK